jgi:hypothetical protein
MSRSPPLPPEVVPDLYAGLVEEARRTGVCRLEKMGLAELPAGLSAVGALRVLDVRVNDFGHGGTASLTESWTALEHPLLGDSDEEERYVCAMAKRTVPRRRSETD